jgi:hypothetical protein
MGLQRIKMKARWHYLVNYLYCRSPESKTPDYSCFASEPRITSEYESYQRGSDSIGADCSTSETVLGAMR